jgi:hypothetical protein
MLRKILLPVLAIALISCKQAKNNIANTGLLYFDIKGYFENEAQRLTKLNPTLKKTVNIDENIESKEIKILNWKQELSIFSDADINKIAWIGKFKEIKTDSLITYSSNDKKIAIKSINIKTHNREISAIEIISINNNTVFQIADTLTYIPDSLYQISKTQKIKLLKNRAYRVKAEFLK